MGGRKTALSIGPAATGRFRLFAEARNGKRRTPAFHMSNLLSARQEVDPAFRRAWKWRLQYELPRLRDFAARRPFPATASQLPKLHPGLLGDGNGDNASGELHSQTRRPPQSA